MNPRALRLLYELLSRIGLNPSLEAADIPDTWIIPFVEGPSDSNRAARSTSAPAPTTPQQAQRERAQWPMWHPSR